VIHEESHIGTARQRPGERPRPDDLDEPAKIFRQRIEDCRVSPKGYLAVSL
jgi:hypothetical protein